MIFPRVQMKYDLDSFVAREKDCLTFRREKKIDRYFCYKKVVFLYLDSEDRQSANEFGSQQILRHYS